MKPSLIGVQAKLDRAEETIKSLQSDVERFLKSACSAVSIKKEFQGSEYCFIASGDPSVPLRFSVLGGEVIHHLRSILDHMVCILAVANGESVSKSHQFPFAETKARMDQLSPGCLKGLSKTAKDLIRQLQPYTSASPKDALFYVLNELDNQDKHRLLNVAAVAAYLGKSGTIGGEGAGASATIIAFGDPSPRKLSAMGVKIWSITLEAPAPGFDANMEFEIDLAFERAGTGQLMPYLRSLGGFLAAVRHALETLAPEIK